MVLTEVTQQVGVQVVWPLPGVVLVRRFIGISPASPSSLFLGCSFLFSCLSVSTCNPIPSHERTRTRAWHHYSQTILQTLSWYLIPSCTDKQDFRRVERGPLN
ncbi:hypothetical protein, variant [Exophiala dermatitidis NIH/UT8656]|uniref:Uncharacterized protein n=1 Tax=Exophiala dermatitidis (strain ATCC 34100 / CBS 525.76 / NIH/UT8656) TaxID=858893 RepID=H6C154_EXODN|nr:uncharacterized protein HMPREF1120_04605 [Exophiala dermatitidis NIH/UT8656]XP_009156986.1 hypothetical protein, variant [Exophiala dermatitidis NIH/UT8656]EHY56524.1 hypothetical protein, variant [Exophiala dermatitidis NIH/UT8656]EHY56525.1 hypothetical protein HMPREF1120_04605 [Exophiala dermatitidis NIH/UT8656]